MTTVAIVPAVNRADTVADTVAALDALPAVDRVVVVDDGSTDATADAAAAAGATVVRLPENRGKGAAVSAAVTETPDADVYLLIDADLARTAGMATALLAPVLSGDADMSIAVLPGAGRRGGFGSVRRLAAAGIRKATGFSARAPLSGQRAVAGPLLRSLALADRFGLETAMTIDAIELGATVVEVDVSMDHRHTGRGLAGFRHRAGQGVDILRALWPRLTSRRFRVGLVAITFVAASLLALAAGRAADPDSVAMPQGFSKVVVFGFPRLTWDDVGTGRLPALDALVASGASAATSVRTLSSRPNTAEGYATLGAGTRVAAEDAAGFAFDASAGLEGGTAGVALARRTGRLVTGQVAVVGAPATTRLNEGRFLTSRPGALGDALHAAGKRTAVINNADTGYVLGERASVLRPAAAGVMDSGGSVDIGAVGRDILRPDPAAPFGYRADPEAMLRELETALAADVILVDTGDADRAAEFAPLATTEAAEEARRVALTESDRLLAAIQRRLPPSTLLLVTSVVPPTKEWRLTPTVAAGPDIPLGELHSPSTRRAGVVTLTDIAPTVLAALDVAVPAGMIGHPLRLRPGPPDLTGFRDRDRDASFRERIYLRLTLAYIVLQALLYLLAIVVLGRNEASTPRAARWLRPAVLAVSAYPLATFLFRAVPNVANLGGAGVLVLLAIDAAIVVVASRFRRHPLSPLSWILAATVAVLALDVATGAHLQTSSLLGYSLHTAARFTGLGNTAFATLAATTVLLGAIHVAFAPRRQEALLAVACLFGFVVLIDGAPALGSDVGGILTLVPVFALTLLVLSGRRLSLRAVVTVAAVTLVALALAAGVDLLRPPTSRTHLGRLVANIGHGGIGEFSTTASRKLAVNLRSYRSPWAWVVGIVSLYMLYVLGRAQGWQDLLPARSPLRAGVVGTLAAGLLGYAVNDSGVVVTAVVFVYLGPFLTLVALRRGVT